jgi:transcription elongation factor GreA
LIKDVQIPDTLEVLKDARSQWDLSENSDYHGAKEKLSLLQRRIVDLEDLIESVEIIRNVEKIDTKTIKYGSKITLEIEWDKEFTVNIVWSGEVAIFDDFNISFDSPLWMAMEWKKQWDIVEVRLSNVKKKVSILSVS